MITFVKDEGSKMVSMVIVLWSIINCKLLNLQLFNESSCFGHVIFKAYKYATNNDKVCSGLKHKNMKRLELVYKKQLHGTKSWGKPIKSKRRLVLTMGCIIKN
jgi:hypothetical protein